MRILIINTSPFIANGITNVITNYYKYMDKRDMQIEVVAINEPSESQRRPFTDGGSQLYVLKRRNNAFLYFVKLIEVMRKGKYDVVHIHGNSALMAIELAAACLTGVKRRIVHSHTTNCSYIRIHKLLWPLFMVLATDRLACGKRAGEWLYRNSKFMIMNNGIDLDRFRFDYVLRKKYRKSMGVDNEILIGHVGHFSESKNHRYVVELFEAILVKNSDCRLLLIGDGPDRKLIEEEIVHRGLLSKIIMIPITSEMNCYMSAMDVLILPSLFEGFPVVSVEAQAADLPCVFSDAVSRECDMTGGIQFFPLQDKAAGVNAVLAAPKETRDSAEAIQKLAAAGYDIKANASILRSFYASRKRN